MSKLLLDVKAEQGIFTLTINRPEARNALDWEAQNLFLASLQQLRQDPRVRVLIITGSGEKAFCAGGDLVELAAYPAEADGARLAAVMSAALKLIEEAPFPSIAAINGHALGGGAELATACDLRIMSSEAQMGFVQLSLGLTPGWGAGQRLARLLGYSRALHLLLNAQVMPAEELLQLGLVNLIAPPHQVLATAGALAERIAGWDGAAVGAVKAILRASYTQPSVEAEAIEQAAFPPLWAAPAHLEAVARFLNKSKPKKSGEA
jgi:enoyl-CoA hydratase